MRLITRSDFDGLACGALLLEAKVVDSWMFAHPKDIQQKMTFSLMYPLLPVADFGLTTIQARKNV